MRRVSFLALALLLATGCPASAGTPKEKPKPVTLAEVNETPCTKDADCAMTTTQCQSGCSGVAVNTASPRFPEFERQRLEDPCCRPDGDCRVTACAQILDFPRCVKQRCVLTERPPPKVVWYLSARAFHQCAEQAELDGVVEAERLNLSSVAGLVTEVRAAPGLFVRPGDDPCRPKDPRAFFDAHPSAGKKVYEQAQEPQCKACGCFAPLYLCVKAVQADELFAKLGYAPVTQER